MSHAPSPDEIYYERMVVTAVHGNVFAVTRGGRLDDPIAHPQGALVEIDALMMDWVEAPLSSLLAHGNPTPIQSPLDEDDHPSKLGDRALQIGITGSSSLLESSLAGEYDVQTPLYMAVGADYSRQLEAYTFTTDGYVVVDDADGLPAAPFTIRIDDELLTVDEVADGGLLYVTRGVGGTTAVEHDAGAEIIFGNDIAASDVTLMVADASPLPPAPFLIDMGTERARVTAVDVERNLLTLERGVHATMAKPHAVGVQAIHGRVVQLADVSDVAEELLPVRAVIGSEHVVITAVDTDYRTVDIERADRASVATEHVAGATLLAGFAGRHTLLTAPIATDTQTEVTIAGLPETVPPEFFIKIHNEVMRVRDFTRNADSTLSLTVDREALGSAADPSYPVDANVLFLWINKHHCDWWTATAMESRTATSERPRPSCSP